MTGEKRCERATYGNVQEVLRAFREQLLVAGAEGERLEDVARAAVPLEHRVVDHVAQVWSATRRGAPSAEGADPLIARAHSPNVCQLSATSWQPADQNRCGS